MSLAPLQITLGLKVGKIQEIISLIRTETLKIGPCSAEIIGFKDLNFVLKILVNEGCPQKFISVWQAKEGIRSGFRDQCWLVLNSSGNFLSNGYKNLGFLSKNEWEKGVQRCLPISYKQKVGKISHFWI